MLYTLIRRRFLSSLSHLVQPLHRHSHLEILVLRPLVYFHSVRLPLETVRYLQLEDLFSVVEQQFHSEERKLMSPKVKNRIWDIA
jgi:hypothetical protein